MKFNKIYWTFFLLIFLSKTSFGQLKDTLNWTPNYCLKVDDFKGKPDTTKIDVANSYINITYDYQILNNKLDFKVYCFFYKNLSWIKYDMETILKHEQGHFDIAKLFALTLEEKFKNYTLNVFSVKKDLQEIYDATVRERTSVDNEFDNAIKNANDEIPQDKFIKDIWIRINIINPKLKGR